MANLVEKCSLAVVNVAHYRNYWGAFHKFCLRLGGLRLGLRLGSLSLRLGLRLRL